MPNFVSSRSKFLFSVKLDMLSDLVFNSFSFVATKFWYYPVIFLYHVTPSILHTRITTLSKYFRTVAVSYAFEAINLLVLVLLAPRVLFKTCVKFLLPKLGYRLSRQVSFSLFIEWKWRKDRHRSPLKLLRQTVHTSGFPKLLTDTVMF